MAYHQIFNALADQTRRLIFERLKDRQLCVREIADEMPVSRPAVSQHLKVLKDAELVSEQKKGTRNYYSVRPDTLKELRDYVDDFWGAALSRFESHVNRSDRKEK